jgi:hypothetical protein
LAVTAGTACATLAVGRTYTDNHDWRIVHDAAGALVGTDGLTVYALHPTAQEGPVALLLAALPHDLYAAVVGMSLALFLLLAQRITGMATPALAVVAAAMFWPWWHFSWEGHADDALVALGGAVLLLGLTEGRRRLAGVGFAVAIAAKPTALLFAPLLLSGVALPVAAIGVGVWLPFALAHPVALLHAGGGVNGFGPHTIYAALGLTGPVQPWVRPVELAAGLLVGVLLARDGRPADALVAAFTVRALLEPTSFPTYSAVVIAFAVIAGRRRWTVPMAIPASVYGTLIDVPVPLQLGLLVLVLGVTAMPRTGRPRVVAQPDMVMSAT